jgi:hypothetical protein
LAFLRPPSFCLPWDGSGHRSFIGGFFVDDIGSTSIHK